MIWFFRNERHGLLFHMLSEEEPWIVVLDWSGKISEVGLQMILWSSSSFSEKACLTKLVKTSVLVDVLFEDDETIFHYAVE